VPERIMRVEWEDGAELSQSQKSPGAHSPLVRDADNNLVGQVILNDVDDYVEDWRSDGDEEDWQFDEELAEQIGALVVLAVIFAARKAAPYVSRWWNDRATPFLKKSGQRVSRRRRRGDQAAAVESTTLEQFAPTESSPEVLTSLEDYRASMSNAEARERFVAALVAKLYSEAQLRILRNAWIEDTEPDLDLASAMETLTPQQLGESITAMLEANPSWPDKDTLAELSRMLGSNSPEPGQYVSVERGRIRRALHRRPSAE
jgi:hypothetical protein